MCESTTQLEGLKVDACLKQRIGSTIDAVHFFVASVPNEKSGFAYNAGNL